MKFVLPILLGIAVSASAQTYSPIPTETVGQFLDSLGVNTHLSYTDGDYRRDGDVVRELQYLGIHNVRDNVPNAGNQPAGQYVAALNYAASQGVRFDLVANCNIALSDQMQAIDALVAAHPGAVTAVEGTNEVNNYPCNQGPDAANFQSALFSAVHTDKALAGASVYDFTGGAKTSTLSGRADYANNHPYPNISRGTTVYARMVSDYADYYAAQFPRVITEDGYQSLPDHGDGVDPAVQAVGTLQQYFSAAALGIQHTYLYELMDAYAPGTPPYSTWGLFSTVTGEAKPAAVMLHNLTGTLAQLPRSGASTAQVKASIAGLPADGHAVALTDGWGGVSVWLWRDITPWNVAAQSEAFPPDVSVSVSVQGQSGACVSYGTSDGQIKSLTRGSTGTYAIGVGPSPRALYCSR